MGRVTFEKCLGRRGRVVRVVLASVKTSVMLLVANAPWSLHGVGLAHLLIKMHVVVHVRMVVMRIHVLHIRPALSNHRQLLHIRNVVIRVRRHAYVAPLLVRHVLNLSLRTRIVVTHLQVRQLLLCLSKFLLSMLFGGVDGRNFTLFIVLGGKVTPCKLVRMFRVLTERVGKVVSSDALLSHRILLLQHQLLLFYLSEPGMFKGLRGRNSIIRIVHQQFDN